jgi:hypothetical protein
MVETMWPEEASTMVTLEKEFVRLQGTQSAGMSTYFSGDAYA